MTLGEKECRLKEVEKERMLWRQQDGALAAVVKEKEELIQCFKQQLEARQTDVEVRNSMSSSSPVTTVNMKTKCTRFGANRCGFSLNFSSAFKHFPLQACRDAPSFAWLNMMN